MMYVLIWLVVTAAMFVSGGVGIPLIVGLVAGLTVSVVRNQRRRLELERLGRLYSSTYGEPPPGSPVKSTGVGFALGSLAGSSYLGGLLGAAVDMARFASSRADMPEAQRELHAKIAGLRSWSPYHALYVLVLSLGLSAGITALVGSG
jgi:hypothetical protein